MLSAAMDAATPPGIAVPSSLLRVFRACAGDGTGTPEDAFARLLLLRTTSLLTETKEERCDAVRCRDRDRLPT
jgi:hypothetical protein